MRVTIKGGTATHDQPSLCLSCRHATVVRGPSLRHEIVECDQLSFGNRRVTFPVMSCSNYANRSHPTIREMEETAWILRSDPHRNQIGFVRASRLSADERYVLDEE
jgi:hypothetical protein